MTILEEDISGFLIFAFVFEIWPILFPHTLRGVQATPNQHLLGKSPDLHAEVQQFKPHSGHIHAFLELAHTYTMSCTRTLVCVCMCLCVWVHACPCVCVLPYASNCIIIVDATPSLLPGCYLHPYFGQFFYLVCR